MWRSFPRMFLIKWGLLNLSRSICSNPLCEMISKRFLNCPETVTAGRNIFFLSYSSILPYSKRSLNSVILLDHLPFLTASMKPWVFKSQGFLQSTFSNIEITEFPNRLLWESVSVFIFGFLLIDEFLNSFLSQSDQIIFLVAQWMNWIYQQSFRYFFFLHVSRFAEATS